MYCGSIALCPVVSYCVQEPPTDSGGTGGPGGRGSGWSQRKQTDPRVQGELPRFASAVPRVAMFVEDTS